MLLVQVENVVVLATGLSASADDPCAVLHTGRLDVSNVALPTAAARSKALQWLLVRGYICAQPWIFLSFFSGLSASTELCCLPAGKTAHCQQLAPQLVCCCAG